MTNQFSIRTISTAIVTCLLPFFLFAQSYPKELSLAGFSLERLERLDQYFSQKAQTGELPGGVCMIYRKGSLVYEMAFGNNNMEEKSLATTDQIFYIQSMTKPIVSVGLMMLYEEGYFDLNDPIEKYLPQFKDRLVLMSMNGKDTLVKAQSPPTIAQCFSHTAGFLHGLSQQPLDVTVFQGALW